MPNPLDRLNSTIQAVGEDKVVQAQLISGSPIVVLHENARAVADGRQLNVSRATHVVLQWEGFSDNMIVSPELSLDGKNWLSGIAQSAQGTVANTISSNGIYLAPTWGAKYFRARISTYVGGGLTLRARAIYGGMEFPKGAGTTGYGAVYLPNLEFAEDDPHSSGNKGIQLLAVYHAISAQDAGTENDYSHLVVDANGALFATLATLLSGEDQTLNRLWGGEKNNFVNITSQTTTVVKTGAGKLHAVIFNKPLATSVVTLYDNTAASGTVIGTITLPAALTQDSVAVIYDIAFATGLTVVTATASSDITVAYL